jgi:hypothetical protein
VQALSERRPSLFKGKTSWSPHIVDFEVKRGHDELTASRELKGGCNSCFIRKGIRANIIPFGDPGPQPVFRQIPKENLDNGAGPGAIMIGSYAAKDLNSGHRYCSLKRLQLPVRLQRFDTGTSMC